MRDVVSPNPATVGRLAGTQPLEVACSTGVVVTVPTNKWTHAYGTRDGGSAPARPVQYQFQCRWIPVKGGHACGHQSSRYDKAETARLCGELHGWSRHGIKEGLGGAG